MFAAPYGTPELVRTLLDAGANVNARDIREMTPLMLAVSSETQDPEVVRLLLARGADVKPKSVMGETALDWAMKFGSPHVIRLLQQAGAETAGATQSTVRPASVSLPDARGAVEKGVAVLQASSTEFFKQSGCVGCHHQLFTAMAVGAARQAGVHVDRAAEEEQVTSVKAQWARQQEGLLQRIDPPGAADQLIYSLLGLAAAGYPADATTDALVVNLAGEQTPEGSWCLGGVSRSPISESCIARAAMGIRVFQLYGPAGLKSELDRRSARARDYLLSAEPVTASDRTMLVRGLKWAGADQEKVRAAVHELLREQRDDGGWAGNPNIESDAFSTGEAIDALRESGVLESGAATLQRGVAFLLKTQQPDGSWHVKSRAPKFQPYFQSGFPYDHDQWISAAGTAWATIALANVLPGSSEAGKKLAWQAKRRAVWFPHLRERSGSAGPTWLPVFSLLFGHARLFPLAGFGGTEDGVDHRHVANRVFQWHRRLAAFANGA